MLAINARRTVAILVLLLAIADVYSASLTLLITGHSTNNVYKHELASKFVPDYDQIIRGSTSDFLFFHRGAAPASDDSYLSHTIANVPLESNISTVVVSRLGSDEMSLSHIGILYDVIKTDRAMLVVEIGEPTIQTRALLNKGTLCWGEARVSIRSPNTVFLCNDIDVPHLSVIDLEELRSVTEPIKNEWLEPQPRPFWPCLFASAKLDKYKKKAKEDDEEDVEDIVEEILEDIQKQQKPTITTQEHHRELDKKLACKYRKSCYETGELPEIQLEWFAAKDDDDDSTPEDIDGDGVLDSEDDDIDLTALKLKCKYRHACYKERNVPLSAKDEEKEQARSLLSVKKAVVTGKKKTLKDIAEKNLKNLKEAETKAAARPLSNAMIVEKRLNAIEDKMNEKLQCKYRKSCYETGVPPDIDEDWTIPFYGKTESFNKEEIPEVNYEQLEELERKVHCKYRKSCYETGIKPDVESDIQFNSFADITAIPEVVETRKMTLQEKCKYRKSCYETGILPDIGQSIDEIVSKKEETTILMPSNVQDLKSLCKYRKSCYHEVADSATLDTIKTIKKKRLIEKEVKKRKAQRTRMRRRVHGSVDMEYYRKPTRKEKYKSSEVKEKNDEDAKSIKKSKDSKKAKSSEVHDDKKDVKATAKKNAKAEEAKKEKKEEKVEEVKPEKKEKKTSGKKKAVVAEKDEEKEEEEKIVPVPVPVPVVEKEQKKSSKKSKKAAVTEPIVEEEPELVKEEEKEPETPKEEEKPAKSHKKQKAVPVPVPVPVKEEEPDPEKETKSETKPKADKQEGKKMYRKIKTSEKEEPKEEEKEEKETSVEEKEEKKEKKAKKEEKKEEHKPEKKVEKKEEEKPKKEEKKAEKEKKEEKKPEKREEKKEKAKKDKKPEPVPVATPASADDEDRETKQKQKDFCKYRKSCYESGEKPVIDQSVSTLYTAFDKHVDKVHKEEERAQLDKEHSRSESDQKLDCKYRRSCYDTGKLPDLTIRPDVKAPSFTETLAVSSLSSKRLGCKYRRSCYAEMGINEENDQITETEEKRQPVIKTVPKEQPKIKAKESASSKKDDDSSEDTSEEDDSKEKDSSQKAERAAQAEELHDGANLSTAQKLDCKYRRSCYSSVEPRATNEDHSGTMARQQSGGPTGAPKHPVPTIKRDKCHIYYLSCREQMGLPPKEKAPIGPKGKRLCRKKKAE